MECHLPCNTCSNVGSAMKSKSYDWRYGDEAVDSDEQSDGVRATASTATAATVDLNMLGLESITN